MTELPDVERVRAVQHRLTDLSERVEQEPRAVLAAIPELLVQLSTWPQRDAYLWSLHIGAQAFRFVDELDKAVATAGLGLEAADENSGIAAGLHLEAGMALNQKGSHSAAELHLRAAARTFQRIGDQVGVAWTLVAVADALCGLARQDEALGLVNEAEAAARAVGDHRSLMRALKQRAVVQRQRGDLTDALEAIDAAVEGTHGHARANALLERGHILTMSQDYTGATDAFVAATVEYAACEDTLGLANTARALATVELLLGRDVTGLHHLDVAADLYRELGNRPGLGYTLRERSLVRLSLGDSAAANADATEAVTCFDESGDLLGLTGAWRAVARVAHAARDAERTSEALGRAEQIARQANNTLAVAGVRLMQAEIGELSGRVSAAAEAYAHYDRLHIPTGAAHAAAFAARAMLAEVPDGDVLGHLAAAASRLRRARRRVIDPGHRADHDLSLRDVTATIVETCAQIGTEAALMIASDAVLESFPLGLRVALSERRLSPAALELAARVQQLGRASEDPQPLRALLRRLAVAVTTLSRTMDENEHHVTLQQLRSAAPHAAFLLVGAPTPSGHVPVVHALPGTSVSLELPALSSDDVDAVEALGHVVDTGTSDILWRPEMTTWQDGLALLFLPATLRTWVTNRTGPELFVIAHPTIAHVPFEALHVAPLRPLGAAAAVRRLPVPVLTAEHAKCDRVVAFFDPSLDWSPERHAVGWGVASLEEWLSDIEPNTLAIVGAHGEAATGFGGWLTTTDRADVFTAGDLLTKSLSRSVVILEACWAGRHVGHRTGETLNMATSALLAGAAAVIAGLWALPADPACTGRIAAECMRRVSDGVRPAEAFRVARARYLADAETPVRVPGNAVERMSAMAPWSWAGLCAYG